MAHLLLLKKLLVALDRNKSSASRTVTKRPRGTRLPGGKPYALMRGKELPVVLIFTPSAIVLEVVLHVSSQTESMPLRDAS